MSSRDRVTLAQLTDWTAGHAPDRIAVKVENDQLTYAELRDQSRRVAAGFQGVGVAAGDVVALVLPNSVEFVVAWVALGRIGATAAPINTELGRGRISDGLRLCNARVAVVAGDRLPEAMESLRECGDIATVIDTSSHTVDHEDPRPRSWAKFAATSDDELVEHTPSPGDPSILLFTSGSTGKPKACVLSNHYVVRQAEIFVEQLRLKVDDVLFTPFPLFHADAAIFTLAPALVLGTTAALVERFSVSQFWNQVRQYSATVFDFMGATLSMLHKQPASPEDASNPARLGWGVPLPGWADEFEQRFGLELVEVYGLSDTGIVLYNSPGQPRRDGSCGKEIAAFEVKTLDADGFETAAGEVGEICVRPREPHLIMEEYLGMPSETLAATRGLWFHTEDLAYKDDDGYFHFVGRTKDIIRRRGENVPAPVIEDALASHPDVADVAAFGVPSELTEEDIMVAVSFKVGRSLAIDELIDLCTRTLPRSMVPRYFRVLPELPRTPTEKVEKHVLKAAGVQAGTFDRDAGVAL
ncbi:AMP-binding protein (plasmid) [Prescottella equi]|uniref:AMP-binding protein n=1 Tax=Rhodococcus hoagii TaxID=43767 RepID=UPI00257658AB|nr:AMP-binding protein [Prescottella equi]WJJ14269.1 AMP-binding protein [Prescottella equi]